MPDDNNVSTDDQAETIAPTENGIIEDKASDEAVLLEPRSRFNKFIDFIKKHKIALLITLAVILALAALYVFIPIINVGETSLTNANTLVKIKDGQTVKLKISDVSVKVTHFTNDACPQGKTCFGTGQKAVEYQLMVNGKKYATGSQNQAKGVDYKVETISSDYKTYAEIKIVKLN